jgi:sortase (surface protein transpeptidase)
VSTGTLERPRAASRTDRIASVLTTLVVVALLGAALVAVVSGRFGSAPTAPAAVPVPAAADAPAVPLPLAASAPTGIEIPAIGVTRDSVMKLGFTADMALQVPPDAYTVGWFSRGAAPGTDGPAVFASHINYAGKKGGFADIGTLTPGAEVVVHRADRTTVVFTVDRVERASKQAFPTSAVYGPTARPEVRLITCGGPYDASTRNYEDNVIVFGHAERASQT